MNAIDSDYKILKQTIVTDIFMEQRAEFGLIQPIL